MAFYSRSRYLTVDFDGAGDFDNDPQDHDLNFSFQQAGHNYINFEGAPQLCQMGPWLDDATSFSSASELHAPSLTHGHSQDSSLRDIQTYAPQDIFPLEGCGPPYEYQDSSGLMLGEDSKESAPQVDLQYIGEAPDTCLPRQVPRLQEDDLFSSFPTSKQQRVQDGALLAIPASYHLRVPESGTDIPIVIEPKAATTSVGSQHMRRSYSEDRRKEVAAMRDTKACVLCRTRRVKVQTFAKLLYTMRRAIVT